jgi:hypothetical protein
MHELVTVEAVQQASLWTNISKVPQWLQGVYTIYGKVVLTPLARLYIWGPSWGTLGFWGGKPMHDICAQLTSLSSDFWLKHPEQCVEVVSKTFYSLIILVETVVYVVFLLWVCKKMLNICRTAFQRMYTKETLKNSKISK